MQEKENVLKQVCIISDNHFFSAGLHYLLEGENHVTVKLPQEIESSAELLSMNILYVYVRDRKLHCTSVVTSGAYRPDRFFSSGRPSISEGLSIISGMPG